MNAWVPRQPAIEPLLSGIQARDQVPQKGLGLRPNDFDLSRSTFSSPELLGLIVNGPVVFSGLSFQDHMTKKRRALGTRIHGP